MENMFTVYEVAKKLKLSHQVVRKFCREGKLGYLRMGGGPKRAGKILITEKSLKWFLDDCVVEKQ